MSLPITKKTSLEQFFLILSNFLAFGRICGRKNPAAIGFHNKGHPYYITMQMIFLILPATLTPLGSRSKVVRCFILKEHSLDDNWTMIYHGHGYPTFEGISARLSHISANLGLDRI